MGDPPAASANAGDPDQGINGGGGGQGEGDPGGVVGAVALVGGHGGAGATHFGDGQADEGQGLPALVAPQPGGGAGGAAAGQAGGGEHPRTNVGGVNGGVADRYPVTIGGGRGSGQDVGNAVIQLFDGVARHLTGAGDRQSGGLVGHGDGDIQKQLGDGGGVQFTGPIQHGHIATAAAGVGQGSAALGQQGAGVGDREGLNLAGAGATPAQQGTTGDRLHFGKANGGVGHGGVGVGAAQVAAGVPHRGGTGDPVG